MKKLTPTIRFTAVAAALGLALAGCSTANDDTRGSGGEDSHGHHESASNEAGGADHEDTDSSESGHESGGHKGHAADGGDPPEGIKKAADPKFDVGDTVVLSADHMPGMKGAEATVSGAFDTTTYSISYTPTDGGDPVKDHKWVVHEELKDPGKAPLKKGDKATVNADHMPGMKGAETTIDSATDETVYMVDIKTDEMEMKNHKWMTESELKAAD
ncbi:YdhK family protein [Brevibacterium sp. JSBI002]|uniref:YdhK family protein n=1 Tax=Brevibacterium sp. JSBI002 TaxID=2886045 RepID=UPI00222EBCF5|nr:YdhK family protein [Brevibacterium sp. JSBI002]UZD61565.1 YdhK family protein [Brevibacterium sp. JSBI002]